MKEASFFEKMDDHAVRCVLCPHNCVISDGKSGICGARVNHSGVLYTANYGVLAGRAVDPIEKKPLYHFYPGSRIFSVGTVGCNMRCPFCQNDTLSRYFEQSAGNAPPLVTSPDGFVRMISETLDSIGVAYTYSEPMVWLEYILDTAPLVRKEGFKTVLVSNGLINPEPLEQLLPLVDAVNIDLKAFTEKHYKSLSGDLETVKNSIRSFFHAGTHVEVTTLVVTGFNDNLAEIENIADFLSGISPDIPLHLSRYYPWFQYHEPPTDMDFLVKAKKTALRSLNYVYTGNTVLSENTLCRNCGAVLVSRTGYQIDTSGLDIDKCVNCGAPAPFRTASHG